MRTTVTLDEDVHMFALIYAKAKGITMSAAINDLVRKAEKIAPPPADLDVSAVTGLPMFRRVHGGRTVTTELVRRLENES